MEYEQALRYHFAECNEEENHSGDLMTTYLFFVCVCVQIMISIADSMTNNFVTDFTFKFMRFELSLLIIHSCS